MYDSKKEEKEPVIIASERPDLFGLQQKTLETQLLQESW